MAFQRQQLSLLSTPGEVEPKNSMVWHGKDGIFGVFLNKLIPLEHLKQL